VYKGVQTYEQPQLPAPDLEPQCNAGGFHILIRSRFLPNSQQGSERAAVAVCEHENQAIALPESQKTAKRVTCQLREE